MAIFIVMLLIMPVPGAGLLRGLWGLAGQGYFTIRQCPIRRG
ncbi:hypothetical protein I603_1380 [Erythrobacter dokdonensis DSW-74]|uniref:Uncharacterized protein n=1 Tax=Erythrobacter dokdonensis DSW-74 TaxID=1300349 RepID=A0A1A7BHR1_9SPHN|nr:hypothetical protein I603_1380 [Erythrobacter dokdonensis DSW-74]